MEQELRDRLTKIEVLLDNHLRHHDMWMKFMLFPILVIVISTFVLAVCKTVF